MSKNCSKVKFFDCASVQQPLSDRIAPPHVRSAHKWVRPLSYHHRQRSTPISHAPKSPALHPAAPPPLRALAALFQCLRHHPVLVVTASVCCRHPAPARAQASVALCPGSEHLMHTHRLRFGFCAMWYQMPTPLCLPPSLALLETNLFTFPL